MKRLFRYTLSILLGLLLCTVLPEQAYAIGGNVTDTITWDLDTATGVLTITGTGAMPDYSGPSEMPWRPNYSKVTSIVIGEGITAVGTNNFIYNMPVERISLPSTLKSIGENGFYSCKYVTSITIPAKLTSIGKNAFYIPALTEILVEEGNTAFTSRDGVLFKYDTTLFQYPRARTGEAYVIPSGVTKIGDGAFSGCIDLQSVTIPASVETIGAGAFSACSNLSEITMLRAGRTTFYDSNPFYGCASSFTLHAYDKGGYQIWQTTKMGTLTDHATENRYTFSSLGVTGGTMSNGITWLIKNNVLTITGTGAVTSNPWRSCLGYAKTITVGEGITSLPDYAFEDSDVTTVSLPGTLETLGSGAFRQCDELARITLPDSVTEIGQYCFDYCTALTYVKLSSSLTEIPDFAFRYCSNLTSVTIPESVRGIGRYAFSQSGLTEVEPGGGVTSIGDYAFNSCPKLTSVTLPASLTALGDYVFVGCDVLTAITINGGTAYKTTNGVLFSGDGTRVICYPGGKTETAYQIPDTVTTIVSCAFYNGYLTTILVPAGVNCLESAAFYGTNRLAMLCYNGSEEDWNEVSVGSNAVGSSVKIHYSFRCPTAGSTVVNAVSATCEAGGYTGDTLCAGCGIELAKGKSTGAVGHSWSAWSVLAAPTYLEKGSEKRTCGRCPDAETREVSATGQTAVNGITLICRDGTVTAGNLPGGVTVILAMYNGECMVDVCVFQNQYDAGETTFAVNGTADRIKVIFVAEGYRPIGTYRSITIE